MPEIAQSGVAEAFRMPEAAMLSVRGLDRAALAVTEIKLNHDGFGLTDPIPHTGAQMLAVQLKAIPFHEAMTDGKAVAVHDIQAGDTLFYDMRRDPRANVMTQSHSLHFVLPQALLDQIAEEAGGPRIDEFTPCTGAAVHDKALARLARTILPTLHQPEDVTALFASHFLLTLGYYAAARYGGLPPSDVEPGRLGPLATTIATEMIAARLNGDVELGELAALTGLTPRRFLVAFREETGMAPYQWLALRRLDLAKSLLRQRRHEIDDIAALCGFTDEAQFSRLFARSTGRGPRQWREAALQ